MCISNSLEDMKYLSYVDCYFYIPAKVHDIREEPDNCFPLKAQFQSMERGIDGIRKQINCIE